LWQNIKYYRKVKRGLKAKEVFLWDNKLPSQIYNKYHPATNFGGIKVLNIGCGKCVYKASNVTNVDIAEYDGINLVWDLSKAPYPLESNSYDLIIANHVLEHIPDWFECMKEMARLVKVGGRIEVWVPPISSDTAFSYKDHINRIGLYSFAGVINNKQAGTNLLVAIQDGRDGDFSNLELVWRGQTTIFTWWMLFTPEWFVTWCTNHLRNTVSEEGFKFTKRVTVYGIN